MKRALLAIVAITLTLTACSSDSSSTDASTDVSADTTTAAETAAPETAAVADTTAAAPESSAAPADTTAAANGKKVAAGTAHACAIGKTLSADKLVIATGDPAFPPYVIDDKPENGQGFEAAVARAVAAELGFGPEATTWIRTPFDAAIAPGPKDFDFNLQQFTITEERAKAVDFSNGYYTAAQAVFGLADSAAASVKSMADLKKLKIGAAAGSTSATYAEETIKPDSAVQLYNDNAAAKVALESKQIDAMVGDLPTALYVTGVEIPGTKVFGQIADSGTDQFGMLLTKGSALTECVNLALDQLRTSGELAAITTKWMSDYTSAPVISS